MRQEKVYIETFGCQMNVADTERASTRLRAAGYEVVESAEGADVVLFNTCSVRERAEQKVFTRIGEVRRDAGNTPPLLGVMGCVAQLEGEKLFESAPSLSMVLGTRATDRLPAIIEEARGGGRRVADLGERGVGEDWDVSTAERHSPYVAFVPIIEGCNKFCTYCIVPYSRGREKSRPASEIVKEVLKLKAEGYGEVHLIGQNVNSYRPKTEEGMEQFSGATPFARLLRAVAATGMPRIKFTTSFPRDFHPDIVAALDENENLCDWIHLPVQSGSDRVLRAMRRGYSASDYLRRIEVIKSAKRRYALTSDIIVGFPGETEQDFAETVDLVKACQFDSIYIFKYSERKGTPAAKLADDVSDAQKTARFLALEEIQNEIQGRIFAEYVGKTLSVLVERRSTKSAHDLSGHSTCNKVVNFPGSIDLRGQIHTVRVSEAKAHSLYGELQIAS
jgi:tRNA-2-methylthio-N6-dimethylallyladenosine synthase